MTEVMRRLGACQTLTVSANPDTTDAAAQRKVISTDLYSIDKTLTALGQANLWVGSLNEGNKIRSNSYTAVAKAVLVEPTTSTYTLTLYGYGTTSTLDPAVDTGSTIQTAIRAVASGLSTVTVSPSSAASVYTITLPSASITLELTRVGTPSDTTGSVTQGLASVEAIRPFTTALTRDTLVHLFAKYPPDDRDGLVGMTTLVNQALARLWFIDQLHVHSTDADSQQVSFSLDAYPWLKTRSQIIRVYAPVRWKHTFSYTVPGSSHTLTLDVGYASTVTTASLAGSATASAIQTAISDTLTANDAVGTVTVTSNGSTRTVTVEDSQYADWALVVSTGAAVTTTRERMDDLRFVDGYRLRFHGETLTLEWDFPWQRGQTWFLEVYRPADTWTCPQTSYGVEGTTWATSTAGLVNDYDQCVTDLGEVASMAHYLACRQLALYGPGQESKFWRDEQRRAALIAAQVKSLDLPMDNEPGFRDEGVTAARGWLDKGVFSSGSGW